MKLGHRKSRFFGSLDLYSFLIRIWGRWGIQSFHFLGQPFGWTLNASQIVSQWAMLANSTSFSLFSSHPFAHCLNFRTELKKQNQWGRGTKLHPKKFCNSLKILFNSKFQSNSLADPFGLPLDHNVVWAGHDQRMQWGHGHGGGRVEIVVADDGGESVLEDGGTVGDAHRERGRRGGGRKGEEE